MLTCSISVDWIWFERVSFNKAKLTSSKHFRFVYISYWHFWREINLGLMLTFPMTDQTTVYIFVTVYKYILLPIISQYNMCVCKCQRFGYNISSSSVIFKWNANYVNFNVFITLEALKHLSSKRRPLIDSIWCCQAMLSFSHAIRIIFPINYSDKYIDECLK